MIIEFPKNERAVVSKVSVQISEYSQENGGSDEGKYYCVEVLFPDGNWKIADTYCDLSEAREAAEIEAKNRSADLLKSSFWPNREVTA